jgi:hypothetical protein
MNNETQPIGVLFESINYYKLEDYEKFVEQLTQEQALYVVTQACLLGFKRGIFNLQEVEVLSKSIRLLTKTEEKNEE